MSTAEALLCEARARLVASGAATPALDARLLLMAAAGISHETLIADPDQPVAAAARAHFHEMIARRAAGEPVSRILGRREFYGREFIVTPDVLDPRADTEALIELCLEAFPQGAARVLDLGTGSGIIPLTLLAEWPDAKAVAADISEAALETAGRNAHVLGLAGRCSLVKSHWFSAVDGLFDLVVSNPPYIRSSDIASLATEVKAHDPLLALDGGECGTAPYVEIAAGAAAHLTPGGRVIVEIGAGQEEQVCGLFVSQGFALLTSRKDLGGHVRALCFGRNR